ncbi:MAG: hypothetical protein KAR24_02810 [Candidatus Pacebacteria bacterium]|nr:hypothetical protein [Candidatus Paceibacterota bacterium]
MNTTISNIFKTTLIVLIVLIFLSASYFFVAIDGDESKLPAWIRGSSSSSTAVVLNPLTDDMVKELEIYQTELESVDLTLDFFTSDNSAFTKLKKFKEELPELPLGRNNPFVSTSDL